jgi:hypothetical protein
MSAIPLVILDEHHEAFLAWHRAVRAGCLERSGNTLLHVDYHTDLGTPMLTRSIRELGESMEALTAFTYEELTVGTFIVPAIYRGLIDRVRGVPPPGRMAGCRRLQMYVRTWRREGRLFLLVPGRPARLPAILGDSVEFELVEGSTDEDAGLDGPIILDIDLDYFSLAAFASGDVRIEVTPNAFEHLAADPLHPLRAVLGCRLEQSDDGCHLVFNRLAGYDVPTQHKTSPAVIEERVADLVGFLQRCHVTPQLIGIARSVRSGYTPADQVDLIQGLLVRGLQAVYNVEPVSLTSL